MISHPKKILARFGRYEAIEALGTPIDRTADRSTDAAGDLPEWHAWDPFLERYVNVIDLSALDPGEVFDRSRDIDIAVEEWTGRRIDQSAIIDFAPGLAGSPAYVVFLPRDESAIASDIDTIGNRRRRPPLAYDGPEGVAYQESDEDEGEPEAYDASPRRTDDAVGGRRVAANGSRSRVSAVLSALAFTLVGLIAGGVLARLADEYRSGGLRSFGLYQPSPASNGGEAAVLEQASGALQTPVSVEPLAMAEADNRGGTDPTDRDTESEGDEGDGRGPAVPEQIAAAETAKPQGAREPEKEEAQEQETPTRVGATHTVGRKTATRHTVSTAVLPMTFSFSPPPGTTIEIRRGGFKSVSAQQQVQGAVAYEWRLGGAVIGTDAVVDLSKLDVVGTQTLVLNTRNAEGKAISTETWTLVADSMVRPTKIRINSSGTEIAPGGMVRFASAGAASDAECEWSIDGKARSKVCERFDWTVPKARAPGPAKIVLRVQQGGGEWVEGHVTVNIVGDTAPPPAPRQAVAAKPVQPPTPRQAVAAKPVQPPALAAEPPPSLPTPAPRRQEASQASGADVARPGVAEPSAAKLSATQPGLAKPAGQVTTPEEAIAKFYRGYQSRVREKKPGASVEHKIIKLEHDGGRWSADVDVRVRVPNQADNTKPDKLHIRRAGSGFSVELVE